MESSIEMPYLLYGYRQETRNGRHYAAERVGLAADRKSR